MWIILHYMKSKSRPKTKAPHLVPSAGHLTLEYNRVVTCHVSDFPISALREMVLDPESLPILMMHAHDAVEVGYCCSGSGILFVDNRLLPFSTGDICIIGDQIMHMSRHAIGQPSQWNYFWVDSALLLAGMPDAMEMIGDNPFNKSNFPYILSPARYPDLCRHVQAIIAEMRRDAFGRRSVIKAHAAALMALVYRVARHLHQQKPPSDSEGIQRIFPALHHMISNYAEPMEIDELAELASLSRRHFYRVFLSAVGETPLAYLAQLRARMAAAVLSQSDKSISQVAFEVGFESINTFNRQFRQTLGASPSDWRRQCRRP